MGPYSVTLQSRIKITQQYSQNGHQFVKLWVSLQQLPKLGPIILHFTTVGRFLKQLNLFLLIKRDRLLLAKRQTIYGDKIIPSRATRVPGRIFWAVSAILSIFSSSWVGS